MDHFNHHKPGFTLVEVLLALALAGAVLGPIFASQIRFLKRIYQESSLLQRIYAAENFMLTSVITFNQDTTKKNSNQAIEDPSTKMQFKIKEPNKTLTKAYKDLYAQQVEMTWNDDGVNDDSTIASFIFAPELREAKKK